VILTTMNPLLAGLGPLGTTEIIIIVALLGNMALVVCGIIFHVVYLSKKKK
jgi:hypothetical protein